jgi:hypothetical protein
MKKWCIILFIAVISVNAQAQWSARLGYNYLFAPDWDESFYNYNFARPWNKKELSPLIHGYEARMGWIFRWKAIKSLYVHPQLGMHQFTSRSANNGEDMFVRLRNYSLQCDVNFNPRALFKNVSAGPLGTRFHMYISPALHLWDPHVNKGEVIYSDQYEKRSEDLSMSFSVGAGMGYRALLIAKKFIVTPQVGVRYAPNVTLKEFPNAIQGGNETNLFQKAQVVWLWETGIEVVWIFPRTKSGKGYMRPCTDC